MAENSTQPPSSGLRTRTTDWFHKMDTSRDGKISRAELKKGLKDTWLANEK